MLPCGYWFRRQFKLTHFNLDENIYQGCGIIGSSSIDRALQIARFLSEEEQPIVWLLDCKNLEKPGYQSIATRLQRNMEVPAPAALFLMSPYR